MCCIIQEFMSMTSISPLWWSNRRCACCRWLGSWLCGGSSCEFQLWVGERLALFRSLLVLVKVACALDARFAPYGFASEMPEDGGMCLEASSCNERAAVIFLSMATISRMMCAQKWSTAW